MNRIVMSLTDRPAASAPSDIAADAAAMLLRFGFAIFAIVVPSATLMSRWVIVVLVPIAAVLIILSTILRGDPFRVLKAALRSLGTMAGMTASFFFIWTVMSLAWTPLPAEAAQKIFKNAGVIVLGLLACLALPLRMRASNLHLVTIGVALGAFLIVASTLAEAAGIRLLRFPAATPGRSAVLLACLGWAAAAWLMIKNRRLLAALLIGLVAVMAMLGPTGEALLPMATGLAVLALAWSQPERTGTALGALVATLIIASPLAAYLAWLLTGLPGLGADGGMAHVGRWWDVIIADPVHVLTGRGYDAATFARAARLVPESLPVTFVADTWYDLGLIGALGIAILAGLAFAALGRLGLEVAPFALAGLAAVLVYAMTDRGATQTWWMNGMAVFAILLVSVERGRYRTVRPRAPIKKSRGGGLGDPPRPLPPEKPGAEARQRGTRPD